MKTGFSVVYISLIIVLSALTVAAKRSPRQSRDAVAWLETSLVMPLVGNLLIILSDDRTLTIIGSYMYFIGIDIVLMALVNFTNAYCTGIGNGTQKPTVMYVAIMADVVQILLNPFFGHAFGIDIDAGGESAFALVVRIGLVVHRVIDYGVLLCVILIFTIASLLAPRIYRERFTVLLAAIIVVGVMQAYYFITKSAYDRPIIGYSFFGIILFYFAICYRPLRLLDQMLSNIISDLSDAFYVFDPNGKCLWANEEGCRLAGFTGKNYEEITAALIRIFGEPPKDRGEAVKLSVGEGDDLRVYSLEEKYVRNSKGKQNGSYLRIEDITEGEREIKVRDEQIGQISQEAYRDALTGVGNKAAYYNKVNELTLQFGDDISDYAIVMVDINDLKKINDEYGHRSGDIYIKGCCHMICEAFKHSPVFRIGGDEFLVILRGSDFEAREQNVSGLRKAFKEAVGQTEQSPWKRYSASVGMAEYSSDSDTFEIVFKRADQAMYEEKKSFKLRHGSYR